jgi:hypothetical protein
MMKLRDPKVQTVLSLVIEFDNLEADGPRRFHLLSRGEPPNSPYRKLQAYRRKLIKKYPPRNYICTITDLFS